MFKPVISATQVAPLIGKNPYQPFHEAALAVLSKDAATKAILDRLLSKGGKKKFTQLKMDAFADVSIQDSVRKTTAAVKQADHVIALRMDAAKAHEDAIKAKEDGLLSSLVEKLEAVATVKKFEAELAAAAAPKLDDALAAHAALVKTVVDTHHKELPAEVRAKLVSEAGGDIIKQRGLRDEDAILNAYASRNDVVVSERNTRVLRKEFPNFILVGRTDGWVESQNRIVDAKNRKRWWPKVPPYDILQLRVYMNMAGATDSQLEEKFPDGRHRTTTYANDPEEWEEIEVALTSVADRLSRIAASESELQGILDLNTV
jgi:hypothetical protein